MKPKNTPPLMTPRSRKLAAGLIAGLTVLSTSAMAHPPEQAKIAPAEKVAEETPEQEIIRLEGEISTLESDIETAESCAAEAAKSKNADATCTDPAAAEGQLGLKRARLVKVRAQESSRKTQR